MLRKLLQSASLTMLAIFFIVVTLIGGATLFGSSKVRPLFDLSAEALAGDGSPPKKSRKHDAGDPTPDAATPPPHFFAASKAGPLPRPTEPEPQPEPDASAPQDAGAPDASTALLPREPAYFPASKSMGGLALPGANYGGLGSGIGGLPRTDAGTPRAP